MKHRGIAVVAILCLSIAACSSDDDDGGGGGIDIDAVRQVLDGNADVALAAYSDAVDTAVALQQALADFKADPTQDNLDAAKRAWLVSREPYGQTEVYRFRLSPIDSTNYSDEDGPEGSINAWPLGEALIDYVVSGSDFGPDQLEVSEHESGVPDPIPPNNIINTPSIAIDAALLANTATAEDERDVLSGYHAIEFLLWGQDLNRDGSADTETSREMSTTRNVLNSGGHRPLSDFTTDEFASRRHDYMEVAAAQLVADLIGVRDGWAPGAPYRTAFTSVETETEALQKLAEILTGMGTLSEGELAGERMQIAFSSNSQEDEHSCFSDNTHRDIYLNAEGIANSYFGDYAGYDSTLDGNVDQTGRAVSAFGFDELLRQSGLSDSAQELEEALAETKTAYEGIDSSAAIDGLPVDNLIMAANQNRDNPMYLTILALNAQSALIAEIALDLGITSDVVDDDGTGCDTNNPLEPCPA